MIIREGNAQVPAPVENTIIGEFKERGVNRITFKGTGNILYCEEGTRLENCNIAFCSDNAVIYLSANTRHWNKLKIDAWRDVSIYIGKNNYYNNTLTAIISERKNLIVGGDGVYSFGIWIRTADPHILYSIDTKERINPSKSVMIGDHVWLGQNATILKGTTIGSGSVLAANAVIAGKKAPSNTVWGGNPAREIQHGVFFSGDSVHNYTEEKTAASMTFPENDNRFIYKGGEQTLSMREIDDSLSGKAPEERLEILKEIAGNKAKGRFFTPPQRRGFSLFGK